MAVCPEVIVAVGEDVVAKEKSCPVPLSVTTCGLSLALSVIVSVPDLAPLAAGSKKTPMEQLEPDARLLPHAFSTPKSDGLVLTLVMLSGAVPEFVTVTV